MSTSKDSYLEIKTNNGTFRIATGSKVIKVGESSFTVRSPYDTESMIECPATVEKAVIDGKEMVINPNRTTIHADNFLLDPNVYDHRGNLDESRTILKPEDFVQPAVQVGVAEADTTKLAGQQIQR